MKGNYIKKTLLVVLYTGMLGSAAFIFCIGLLHMVTGNLFILHDHTANSSDSIIQVLLLIELSTYAILLFIAMFSKNIVVSAKTRIEPYVIVVGSIICLTLIPTLFRYFVPALMILPCYLVLIFFHNNVDEKVSHALLSSETA